MDTSLEYIEMCRQAKELQEAWEPKDWDYLHCDKEDQGENNGVVVLSGYETDGGFYGHGMDSDGIIECAGTHIWLPRQDQLQEMIVAEMVEDYKWDIVFSGYMSWYDWHGNANWPFEKNWLAYIMNEKFKKRWDGQAWI